MAAAVSDYCQEYKSTEWCTLPISLSERSCRSFCSNSSFPLGNTSASYIITVLFTPELTGIFGNQEEAEK